MVIRGHRFRLNLLGFASALDQLFETFALQGNTFRAKMVGHNQAKDKTRRV